eukprot:2706568-Amphidinium_carterae.1
MTCELVLQWKSNWWVAAAKTISRNRQWQEAETAATLYRGKSKEQLGRPTGPAPIVPGLQVVVAVQKRITEPAFIATASTNLPASSTSKALFEKGK